MEGNKKTVRMRGERQPMPEQGPRERIRNFNEVALGYSEEQAILEAQRCLNCKRPSCIAGCPVEIDIPAFIKAISDKNFLEAIRVIREKNDLPAICGRVCPQETQCEKVCVLAKKGSPVAIGRLERFAADWKAQAEIPIRHKISPNGIAVAVVGSGPGGLICAADLAKMGYQVTIFEALHAPGGVLRYGIPEFRLPKSILQREVKNVESLGVEIRIGMVIGKTLTVPELFSQGYRAVFIATGAGAPNFLGIPGENLNGIYSANEFLTRVNLMNAYQFPEYDTPIRVDKRVAVMGGGNVAMDSARTALRLGAEEVSLIYRRSEAEMPARQEEVQHAREEGIIFHILSNPLRFLSDNQGWVQAMECIRMELGEPDQSGRRRPVPISGSEFIMEVDTVIIAIGTSANPIIAHSTPGLKINGRGYIIVDPKTGQTSLPGVYAGGDIVTGAATVIEAMGAGKISARAIDRHLR